MTLDWSDPFIVAAAREVDAMLPGTEPIAPTAGGFVEVDLSAQALWKFQLQLANQLQLDWLAAAAMANQ